MNARGFHFRPRIISFMKQVTKLKSVTLHPMWKVDSKPVFMTRADCLGVESPHASTRVPREAAELRFCFPQGHRSVLLCMPLSHAHPPLAVLFWQPSPGPPPHCALLSLLLAIFCQGKQVSHEATSFWRWRSKGIFILKASLRPCTSWGRWVGGRSTH